MSSTAVTERLPLGRLQDEHTQSAVPRRLGTFLTLAVFAAVQGTWLGVLGYAAWLVV